MPTPLLASLSVVCPSCDRLNPAGSATCVECQSPTTGPAKSPNIQPASATGDSVPPGLKPAARTSAPAPAAAKPAAAKPAAPAPSHSPFSLVVVGGPAKGQRFRIPGNGAGIGRAKGAILFPEDTFVSAQHALLLVKGAQIWIRDENSASGVYLAITGPERLAPGTQFAVGNRSLRYVGPLAPKAEEPGKPPGYGSASVPNAHVVEEVLVGGRPGRAVVAAVPVFAVGQPPCDWSFPQEPSVAPRHCELRLSADGALLHDTSGQLGTFVRVASGVERPLQPGARLRIGQQLLLLEQS